MGISLRLLSERVKIIREVQTPDGEGGFTSTEIPVEENFLMRIYFKRSWIPFLGPWDRSLLDEKDLDTPKAICQWNPNIESGLFILRKNKPYRYRITRVHAIARQKHVHHLELTLEEIRETA